jgi:hypothetical protein
MRRNRLGLTILEVVSVDLDVLLFVGGNRALLKDRADWTGRLTRAAVDALIRINEELLHVFVVALALGRMNAIHRTDIDTGAIFKAHAWANNYVRHGRNYLLDTYFIAGRPLLPESVTRSPLRQGRVLPATVYALIIPI